MARKCPPQPHTKSLESRIVCFWLALSGTFHVKEHIPPSPEATASMLGARAIARPDHRSPSSARSLVRAPSSRRSRLPGSWSCCMQVPNAATPQSHPLGPQLEKKRKGGPRIHPPRPCHGERRWQSSRRHLFGFTQPCRQLPPPRPMIRLAPQPTSEDTPGVAEREQRRGNGTPICQPIASCAILVEPESAYSVALMQWNTRILLSFDR